MNIKLLETLYELYENIDKSIFSYNNPEIFYKSILFENISFYSQLLSYKGPIDVFNKNKQKIIDFTISKRCRFIPILELLKTDDIMNYIQIITENAIISYDENIMMIDDKEYINSNYIFMVYEFDRNSESLFEKKTKNIPLSVRDDQYINFLKNLIKT